MSSEAEATASPRGGSNSWEVPLDQVDYCDSPGCMLFLDGSDLRALGADLDGDTVTVRIRDGNLTID